MSFKKVWQCGHCGSYDEDKVIVEECCCGMEEEAYLCTECGTLFNKNPAEGCMSCKKQKEDNLTERVYVILNDEDSLSIIDCNGELLEFIEKLFENTECFLEYSTDKKDMYKWINHYSGSTSKGVDIINIETVQELWEEIKWMEEEEMGRLFMEEGIEI